MPHTLRNYFAEKGMITIKISGGENATDEYKDNKYFKAFKFGVAQPGVLCVKPDASVLYSWAINPSSVSLV